MAVVIFNGAQAQSKGSCRFGSFRRRKSKNPRGPWKWLPEKERTLRNGRFCCFCGVPLISAAFGGRKSRKSRGPWKWLPEKERTLGNGRLCCFCGVPLISAAFGGRKSRKSKEPWKWLPEKERTLRNGRFCCFCGVPLISAAFGGRKSRKSKWPWKWLPEKERILRNGRFCCFCGVPLISAAFGGRKSRKSTRALEMASGKGANIAKWTILLLLWCSLRLGSFWAAGNPENPRSPGNGFRKRSEHCEMDDFAAFVGFPSFRQLSAAGNLENPRSLEMGRRFCCFWGSPHFGIFRRPEIQKIQGALEMEPWKWLPEKERTLGNGRFCCFCGVPLISAAFGGRKSRKSKGPWKWLPEKERTLRNGRLCCFCSVPLISAAFGGRKSRKSTEPGNRTTILLLLGFPLILAAFRRPEIQKIQGALEMASEHWEMDDFAAFVVFPSFRQLSAAGNPENPRGPGNGFRKRSEHWEMDDCATFVAFPSFSAAFGGRKSRKSKEPWKWLPEKERTLGNGRFCCFCGVPLISAAFGGRKSRKSKGLGNRTTILLLLGFPSFWQLSAAGKSRKSKGPWKWLANIGKWTILLLLWCSPHFGSFRRPENPENPRGPGNGFRKRSEHCENGRFCCFCRVPLISAAFGGRKSRKSTEPGNGTTILLLLGFPSFRQLSAAGNPENPRGPWKWLPEKERTLRNGRFCYFCVVPPSFRQGILRNGRCCCFCGVPLTSAAFGDRKSRKSKGE